MSRENEPVQHTSEMRDDREERDMKAPGELVTEMWDVRVLVSAENDHGLGNIRNVGCEKGERRSTGARRLAGCPTCIRQGQTLAFRPRRSDGFGADARSTVAVEAVFVAKGRPSDNPLIVHIAHRDQLDTLVTEMNETAEALMAAFWPGPLTLVLPVRSGGCPRVSPPDWTRWPCACRTTRWPCS